MGRHVSNNSSGRALQIPDIRERDTYYLSTRIFPEEAAAPARTR